jgi:putative PIN family toxin of toxin-antitoxin system
VRVFLDTNILVSALLTRGLCADLFLTVATQHDPIIGEIVLEELSRVLRTKFRVPPAYVSQVEESLRRYEIAPRPAKRDATRLRDDSDRWILASARLAKADVLITGDQELLALGDLPDLRIRSPRTFWEEIRRKPETR